jgi:hypothetical protein
MPGRLHDPEDGQAPREQLIVVAKPIAADHGDTQGNGFAIGWTARLEVRAGVARGNFKSGVLWRILSTWQVQPRLTTLGDAPCERAPAHSILAKNRRVYAGDFPSAYNGTKGKHHVQTHQTACQDAPTA